MPNDPAPAGKDLKYALIERERKFLLSGPPQQASIRTVAIIDRYLTGTRLRVRQSTQVTGNGADPVYKLTQKIPDLAGGPGLITTIYINEAEYQALAALTAAVLRKTRHSVPPLGIDIFGGDLTGLYLAEVEFLSDEEMAQFSPPPYVIAEVTHEQRFTGGYLARATRHDLVDALAHYGLSLPSMDA